MHLLARLILSFFVVYAISLVNIVILRSLVVKKPVDL